MDRGLFSCKPLSLRIFFLTVCSLSLTAGQEMVLLHYGAKFYIKKRKRSPAPHGVYAYLFVHFELLE